MAGAFPGHPAYMETQHPGDYKPLYNGNISSMVVGIPKLGETQLYNYGYDQLNRLTSMDTWKGYDATTPGWAAMTRTSDYQERISYDGNGNIQTYVRKGNSSQPDMDELTYGYNRDEDEHLTNNRLRHVKDAISDGNYSEDIDNQADDNYSYDETGNLVQDTKEGIDNIEWTVYGKIKQLEKTDGTTISYTYDVAGNRISKAVSREGTTTTTWYVRDAQGNPMGIYTGEGGSLTLTEQPLYGSSRLGVWNRHIDMDAEVDPKNYTFERGNKIFELSNHLGNVLATISDKKIGIDADSDGEIDFYVSEVVTATDYAPFGSILAGRKYRQSGARLTFGFNGKMNDDEVKGEGNQQDYGMRIYDPRVGRFLSVDPLTKDYPWYTPYQFAGNDVIRNIDLDGGEPKPTTTPTAEGQQEETSKEVTNSRGDWTGTKTQIWNWHGGGVLKKQEYNKDGKLVNIYSGSGWYRNQDYDKVLKTGTRVDNSLAAQAAGYLGMYANGAAGHNWTEQEKATVSNTSLGSYLNKASGDGINQLAASARSFANGRNLNVSGLIEQSSVNVEDLVGVGLILKAAAKSVIGSAAKGGTEGGLNLFKFAKPTTTTAEGWKTGDRMLKMFDQGSPKLNWKQNSGFLRREMRSGNPIFDSYRYPVVYQNSWFLKKARKISVTGGKSASCFFYHRGNLSFFNYFRPVCRPFWYWCIKIVGIYEL